MKGNRQTDTVRSLRILLTYAIGRVLTSTPDSPRTIVSTNKNLISHRFISSPSDLNRDSSKSRFTLWQVFTFIKFVMVYGVENHGLPYQSSTANCIPRDGFNGLSCENFNSANIPIHSQISTTTQNGRKRNSIVASGGCNIDLTGLSREERRRKRVKIYGYCSEENYSLIN